MKSLFINIVYFIIVSIILSLGFYKNQWQVVDMSEVEYRRDVSEIFVMGRLVKSQQDGIFSAGGLLGIGDVSDSSVDGAVIKNQIDKYNRNLDFAQYWTYNSHPGFQGMAYSIFDAYTSFPPERNISIFRLMVSVILSLVFSGLCLWFRLEIGWVASVGVAIFILLSKWVTILGGNMFWSLWVFYLPLLVISIYLGSKNRISGNKLSYAVIPFTLALVKILFSGFEFVTSGLLMIAVPFVYYAVLNDWGWRLLLQRILYAGIGLIGSVVAGLIILGIQIKTVLGNYQDVFEYIGYAFSRRTYGYEELLGTSPAVSENWMEKTINVINVYLNGYAFSISRFLSVENVMLNNLVDGKYLYLILLFLLATIILVGLFLSRKAMDKHKTGMALIAATWFSIIGPLSWLIIFRDHAALHTRLDFIVWEMPFTLYGFALVGFVLSLVLKPKPSTLSK